MLRSAARLAQELGRAGTDRLRRGGGVPARSADLDAATLTGLLGAPVRSVRPLDGTSGTTDRARLALTGDGVPASVFVKTAALESGTRVFGGLARLGEVEVGFYRDLRPRLDVEAPRCLGARFDRATGRFVVVLEDLAARGADFVDTTSPLTPDQVAAALSTLAALHGSTHRLPDPPRWMGTNAGDALLPLVSASLPPLGRRVGRRDASLSARGGDALLRGYRRWAPALDEGPHCVLHGDPHPGNVYLLGDRVGLLDWQAVRCGNPQRDASYLMILSLPTPLRRRHERDLLEHYRRELSAGGGPERTADDTWVLHRRMAAYAYVAAVFTAGLGGLQGVQVADAGLRRAAAAVEDLETVAALGMAASTPRARGR